MLERVVFVAVVMISNGGEGVGDVGVRLLVPFRCEDEKKNSACSPPRASFCIFNVEKKGGRKENTHPAAGLPWQQIRNLYSALRPPSLPSPSPNPTPLTLSPFYFPSSPAVSGSVSQTSKLPAEGSDPQHGFMSKAPLPLHAKPWCRIVIQEDMVAKIRPHALPPIFFTPPLPILYGTFIKQSLVPADSAGVQVTSCLFMRCQLLRVAFIKCDGGRESREGHSAERAAASAWL